MSMMSKILSIRSRSSLLISSSDIFSNGSDRRATVHWYKLEFVVVRVYNIGFLHNMVTLQIQNDPHRVKYVHIYTTSSKHLGTTSLQLKYFLSTPQGYFVRLTLLFCYSEMCQQLLKVFCHMSSLSLCYAAISELCYQKKSLYHRGNQPFALSSEP